MCIKSYLRSLPKEKIYFCPNPGNGGDAFIAHATYQLFDELNINYKIVKHDDDLSNKIAIFGGGGIFVKYYGYGAKFVERHHKNAKKVIIFPQTINAYEKLFQSLGENVDVICRERNSFNFVESTNTKANIILIKDMALNMDVEKTFTDAKKLKNITQIDLHYFSQSSKYRIGILKRYLKIMFDKKLHQKNEMNCLRVDQEKTDIKIPSDNYDISSKFGKLTFTPNTVLRITYILLKYLNNFEVINTNRLHMAIGGVLLGKQVNFYPNSYWKNEAVYNYSLKNQYPNVTWMG